MNAHNPEFLQTPVIVTNATDLSALLGHVWYKVSVLWKDHNEQCVRATPPDALRVLYLSSGVTRSRI